MLAARGEVMHLAELKQKSIADLNDVARELKIEGAVGAIELFATQGITAAMNQVNNKEFSL